MTEKQRDRVYTYAGTLITSILVVLIGFSLEANRGDEKELMNKIENKVDKSEFRQKCGETDQRITTLETKQAQILQKNTETLQEIVKQNATMQTDIAWIKREIDRKTKN